MKLVKVSYEQCRLDFFKEQLAAAQRRLDWSIKHRSDCYDHAEKGEVVAFYEWAVDMAENALYALDDREMLIKLLCKADGVATDAALFDFGTLREQFEVEADYLLSAGVRLKTKQATSDESKRWIPVTERLPEPFELVLAYDSTAKRVAAAYLTRHQEWVGVRIRDKVTHWMPLPEPPKEENQ